MKENFQHKKELKWMPAFALNIKPGHRIYTPRARTDLQSSIPESKIIQPFTAKQQVDGIDLLDGFDRYDTLAKSNLLHIDVPVWVITDELTDVQTKKLILDLGRQKQKTNTDYLVEYEIYNQVVPNEQGKKLGGHNRHKLIAGLMGISTGKLSQILRISKVDKSLIQQVDHGHATLAEVEQEAKKIKRENPEKFPKKESRVVDYGKKVDIAEAATACCPTCKRPFTDMEYKDLPEYFTHGRDETNNQTDWLEPLQEESESTESDNDVETEKTQDDGNN